MSNKTDQYHNIAYMLCLRVLGSDNHIPISKGEFDEIKKAKSILLYAISIEELMDHVLENYIEWENDLLSFSTRNLVYSNVEDIHFQRRTATRRLVNILTTCRMYIDQSKQMTRRISNNVQKNQVEKLFAEEYDKHFEYRVMEALRNHSQHYGSPLHVMTQSWQRLGFEENDKTLSTCIPQLQTKHIIEDKSFKKSVSLEMQEYDAIDMRHVTRVYIASLSKIHQRLREQIKKNVEGADELFSNAMSRFQDHFPGSSITGLCAFRRGKQGEENEWISIIEDLTKNRVQFERKSRNLQYLPNSLIASDKPEKIKKIGN